MEIVCPLFVQSTCRTLCLLGGIHSCSHMNGSSVEHIAALIQDVKQRAARYGRADKIRFAMNAFVISRNTEESQSLLHIIAGIAMERRSVPFVHFHSTHRLC